MTTNKFSWRRLVSVCRKIHIALYDNNDDDKARKHLHALKSLLDAVPSEGSIIEAEARALYYELSGDIASAIDWRLLEVSLIESLHRSIDERECCEETKEWALRGRGQDVLEERLELIAILKRKRT
jgi:hypothetical protein